MLEHLDPWVPLLAQVIIVGFCGQTVKHMVFGAGLGKDKKKMPKWKVYFAVTLPWQALIAGICLGILSFEFGLPSYPAFGDQIGGAVAQGAVAGIGSIGGYELLISTAKEWLAHKQRQLAAPESEDV